MRPERRILVRWWKERPDPDLPDGLRIIDRRVIGFNPHGDMELLVAGDCLPPVPENCEPPWRHLHEVVAMARTGTQGGQSDGD